jgi:hypothetical protein
MNMNLRQAKKIINQETPPETDPRNRIWRYRYKKANAYIGKLYKNKLRKQRKSGKKFLSPDEIDQLITDVMQEFKEE